MASKIAIENAQIRFRNFSGKPGEYNLQGFRNFCVLLDEELAVRLQTDGWNVKRLKPKSDDDYPEPYLSVTVSFKIKQPRVVLIATNGKSILTEETVGLIDFADITYVDLVIEPSEWNVNGKSGIKAYLSSIYVTVQEDEFEKKYYDTPDSGVSTIGGCGNCDECDGSCDCQK